MVKMLRYCIYSAQDARCGKHPQKVMIDLGITYKMAVPQSIADQWWFYCPNNLPDELPKYLKLGEVNPYNHVGWGLSKEDADMLSEEKE